jgi:cytokinin dehydrogenase
MSVAGDPNPNILAMAWASLLPRFGARASRAPEDLESCAWDFGGVVHRVPGIVLHPADAEDVGLALKVAADHRLPLGLRGTGHSQAGQGLISGGIVLDMCGMQSVRVDPERAVVEADAGATWQSIVTAAFAHGLLPTCLTLVTDPTIGGTLSMGGVGSQSFRTGAQVNNVLELDVMTIDGQRVRCSPSQYSELFDAVRAGLGQCGVIVAASYPLRRCKPKVRTYRLAYRDARALVDDLVELSDRPRCELMVAGFGPRDDVPGKFEVVLTLGKEFDQETELDDAALHAGLHPERVLPVVDSPLWDPGGLPGHPFFRLYTGSFWHDGAAPRLAHPWVDHIFTPERAVTALTRMLESASPALRMGTVCLIPVANTGHPAPLLVLPSRERLHIGVGVFPKVPSLFRRDAAAVMAEYARQYCELGAKRYLSGYVDYSTAAEWAEHYGEVFAWFERCKERYDPNHLLTPGFLAWPM